MLPTCRSVHKFTSAQRWNPSTCFLIRDQTGCGSFQMSVRIAHMLRNLMRRRVKAIEDIIKRGLHYIMALEAFMDTKQMKLFVLPRTFVLKISDL